MTSGIGIDGVKTGSGIAMSVVSGEKRIKVNGRRMKQRRRRPSGALCHRPISMAYRLRRAEKLGHRPANGVLSAQSWQLVGVV